MSEEVKTGLMGLTLVVSIIWNLYQYSRLKGQDLKAQREEIDEIKKDVEGLKTKMGLFWHLVEDHMSNMLPHGNPIHLTVDEQSAGRVYHIQKRNSPTPVLKKLAPAIERELNKQDEETGKHPYMSADEIVVFTCILGAIKSQLYDRGEWRPEDDD